MAAGRVGLITHKDCKAAMAEALGIPAGRTGHFWGMRGSNAARGVWHPVGGRHARGARRELIARLARAYYHADRAAIDETSVRGEHGVWHYLDPRMRAECITRWCAPN